MDRLSVTVTAPAPGADSAPNPASAPPADDGPSFGDFLRALNPLQHLPVVGTIYRAITGDTIPESARIVGSLVMGALTGGILGVLISAASNAVQSITGIEPDKIANDVFAGLGLIDDAAPPAVAPPAVAPPAVAPSATAALADGSLEQAPADLASTPAGEAVIDVVGQQATGATDSAKAIAHAKAVAAYDHIFSLVQVSA